ncbi:hypothetical protein Y032_0189g1196 [Ancylostoma ceylanicum]|nr:hypothetical protein Y032_0189g1196 [Ancylostoma ceylanicum]
MRYTCINFTENSSAKDKIQVMRDRYGGCSSELGRRGGTQGLWLGDNCMSLRSATHELGHALGLIHTQSRPDRDEAVFVNTENIKGGGKNGDYAKEDKNLVETYGLPYDYGSIMHYDAYSNAIDKKKPAIMPKDELYIRTLGSPSLSYYDKILINKHYGCMENCNATNSIQCANYGFPNPRNCSECICPDGYGGPKCDQRPKGCGKVIRATSSSPRKFSAFVGELKDGQERRECHYWIQAPKGKRIEFKILTVVDWASCGGCFTGGVEIKAKADPRLTGYRYCAPEDKRFTVVSESNLVPVIAYNQGNVFEATIQYRVV